MEKQLKDDIERWRFEIKQARIRAKACRERARAIVSGPIGTRDFLASLTFKCSANEEMALVRNRQNAINEAKIKLAACYQ